MDMYENRDECRFPDTRLVEFCNRFCLSNRIDNPTRVTKTSKSLSDVLLTRVTRNVILRREGETLSFCGIES